MDKNFYTEIKNNNGDLVGWADKRYIKKSNKKIFSILGVQKTTKNNKK